MTSASMIPTPETHRYVGMWRPPFESLWLYPRNQYHFDEITCPCGAQLPNPGKYAVGSTPKILRDHAWAHWFAGHFDEPQYEPLESTARPKPTEEANAAAGETVRPYRIKWRMPSGNLTFSISDGLCPEDAVKKARAEFPFGRADAVVEEVYPIEAVQ